MTKRHLKRQLNLAQVVMLGTAGTIAAEIFVLTGHVAGMAGPASVLVLLLVGVLCFTIAVNYCELGTTYPVTGGALTYVREAWGTGLLAYLVGSLDCLSSTFYSSLSAVGFAYSLRVFIPGLPIVPTAVAVIVVFTILNVIGISIIGRAQTVLGGLLLTFLSIYVIGGFAAPSGFRWDVYVPDGRFFIGDSGGAVLAAMLGTMALIFNAYVGFEVIADDAEEISNPNRNLPRGILISLALITVIYVLVALVTLGVVPWQELADSETALTDAAARFLPGWGVGMMAVAGMIATLTSVNTAMLSATREALTMSRDGMWPRFMSRLGRRRTPYAAALVVGGIVAVIAIIGLVRFLSYISSSGYLFVLFWASLAMIRLRRLYPDLPRPFKVPLFPLTAYLAAVTCAVIIAFTAGQALLFGAGLIAILTVSYYGAGPVSRLVARLRPAPTETASRILVPVANPATARSLGYIAHMLARASEDTSVCLLTVVPNKSLGPGARKHAIASLALRQNRILSEVAGELHSENVPVYTKIRAADSIAEGILTEVRSHGSDKLILLGWPGPLLPEALAVNLVKVILRQAPTGVAMLKPNNLGAIRRILVPIGGGPHSRMAVRIAYEIAEEENAHVTALFCACCARTPDEMQDDLLLLREIIEDELGSVPLRFTTRVAWALDVVKGITAETERQPYDLVVMGASEEVWSGRQLFGSIDDQLAVELPCSMLLVRQPESSAIVWVRRQAQRLGGESSNGMANGSRASAQGGSGKKGEGKVHPS
ncbi:MAG: amino acid permease [Anaerolineae bacterium]